MSGARYSDNPPTVIIGPSEAIRHMNAVIEDVSKSRFSHKHVDIKALRAAMPPDQFNHIMKALGIASFASGLRVGGYDLAAHEIPVTDVP